MKVLVIQQKMIGDVLVSSMLCEQIKKQYPNAIIHYLIHAKTKDVVLNNAYIDKLVFFNSIEDSKPINFLKFSFFLRKEKYNAVIDVYAKIGTAILSFLSGAKTRISYKKSYSSFLYSTSITKSTLAKTNMGLTIEERVSLLTPLGVDIDYTCYPKIAVTDNEKKSVDKILEKHNLDKSKKTFMVSIIGSAANKTYPLKYMSQVVDTIADTLDCNLLFNYIPNQLEQAKMVYNNCKETTQQKIYFDLLGKNLREFIVLMSFCDAIIGNDGGAINIAKALSKPSYIIFSPWINKESWNTYEDGKFHITAHIKDYNIKELEGVSKSELKDNVEKYYKLFTPDLFLNDVGKFVDFINKADMENYKISDSIKVH
ncbi:glycosyltransferase family 9 protein [Wenyingzhuangia sp. IMCC45533]